MKKSTNGVQKVKTKGAKAKIEKRKPLKTSKKIASKPRDVLGKKIPNLLVDSTSGEAALLSKLSGKKVVLYFYPKDLTPGCTIEAEDFSCKIEDFKKHGVEVFGVSRDNLKLHEKFRQKHEIKFDLFSDEDEKLSEYFDVIKLKNMYGKLVRGIERSTFIIDENGKVIKEWRGVKVDGHVNEVFDYIKNLK